MKWLIGTLLCLNLLVFILAYFTEDDAAGYAPPAELPDNVKSIDLLSAYAPAGSGHCTNLGPFEQEIVVDRFTKILDRQNTSYQVISESTRMIAAYRVVIPASDDKEIDALKARLEAAGVDEFYKKTSGSGGVYLSLGVFTYEKTAENFAANLTATGFAARYQDELLEYPARYWLNLKKALDENIVSSLNEFIGTDTLQQTAADCL